MRDSNDAISRLSDNKNDIDGDDTNNNIDEACEPLSVARDDRCEYVKTTPSCRLESANNAFINYRKTYYCVSNWATKRGGSELSGNVLLFSLAFLLIALFFHVLATVAECFFCPALAKISVYLKLRDEVAGATLLAFGNGAPDIFAQIAALNDLTGVTCTDAAGAFYAFPNITQTGLTAAQAQDLFLDKAGVATIAGTSFGAHGEGYVRFSYANSKENILRAIERIRAFL